MLRLNAWFVPFVACSASFVRRLNFGTGLTLAAGGSSVIVARQQERLVDHHAVGHARAGATRRSDEDRLERHVATGLLGLNRRLLVAVLAHHADSSGDERQEPVVVGLQIVVDQRMVVALGALHVAAEEDAADVAREQLGSEARSSAKRAAGRWAGVVAVGLRESRGPARSRACSRAQHFSSQALPFIGRDVAYSRALHQHQVEHLGESAPELRRGEQAIDEPFALVCGRIGEERACFVGGGRHADEIDRHTAEKLGVGTACGVRPPTAVIC